MEYFSEAIPDYDTILLYHLDHDEFEIMFEIQEDNAPIRMIAWKLETDPVDSWRYKEYHMGSFFQIFLAETYGL